MNGSRLAGWAWLVRGLVVVLLLGGCSSGASGNGSGGNSSAEASAGSTSDTSASSSASATSGEPTDLNTTPSAEGSGPEQPQSQQNRPSVEVVGLPIGGGGDPPGAAQQCVGVSWISNTALPAGFAITVTDVSVSAPFKRTGDCPGGSHPSCLNYVFDASNTPQGGGTKCEVGVQWDPTSTVTDDATLSLNGQLTCPSGMSAACAQLKSQLEGQTQSIGVTPPESNSASSSASSPSGESSSGGESSSTETSGSDQQTGMPDTSSPAS